ncbi:hypothetical protein [Methylocapsa palsarum]|uniref:Helix-turn-helix domain-containing protein n=1 Tax=Methylocapsa palsarum TaxID=1612308 RepID=A0A1I3XV43_9HYPH|nr:hypothetical protein [Methylocapsa palsarum]SFK23372.1 hypothetical protein SAMN05444581_104100 [Methylocapsa palsarum]
MTSLHLQEALREPSANAASASTPQPALETTSVATPSAFSPARAEPAQDQGGGLQIAADDSFWVYRPKASRKPAARDAGPAVLAPADAQNRQSGLSLREAAALAGASKSTILRAIQCGRLAAPKIDDGSYAIDRATLFAVFPPKNGAASGAAVSSGKPGSRETKAVPRPAAATETKPDVLAARMAALEAEIKSLKALLGEVNPPRTWWRRLAG